MPDERAKRATGPGRARPPEAQGGRSSNSLESPSLNPVSPAVSGDSIDDRLHDEDDSTNTITASTSPNPGAATPLVRNNAIHSQLQTPSSHTPPPLFRKGTTATTTNAELISPQESTDTLGPLKRSNTNALLKHKLNASSSSLDPITDVLLQRAHPDETEPGLLSRNLSFMSESSNLNIQNSASYPNSNSSNNTNNNPIILVNNDSLLPLNSGASNSNNPSGSPNTQTNTSFFSILKRSSGRPTSDDELDRSFQQDRRDEGWKADVVGYIPNTPVPPKYIHVREHRKHRREREFNRLFLAQELKLPPVMNPNDFYYDLDNNTPTDPEYDPNATPTSGTSNRKFHRSLNNDNSAIWCAKFSDDGRYLAVAGKDKVVRVWEVISFANDREDNNIGRHNSGLRSGSLTTSVSTDSDDSDHNASTTTTNGSSFRSRRSRRARPTRAYAPVFKSKPIREFYSHTSDILDLSWSKNNFLLSSSMDKTVRLWHIDRQECLGSFLHSDFVTSIKFHPKDDRFFISGSLDAKLRLWCIPEKEVASVTDAPDYITATAFSPDGNTVIIGCFGGQCLFYETQRLRKKREIRVRSTRGRNSKGSRITGIEVFQLPPQKRYTHRHAQFDSDIKLLISTNDSRIRLYNLYDGSMEIKFKGHQNEQAQINATFSDDGKYIITGSEDSRTYIWSMVGDLHDHTNKKKEIAEYEYFHSNKSMVTVAIFAPTITKRILAASSDPIYDLCDPPPIELKVKDEERTNSTTSEESHEYPPLRAITKKSLHRDGNIIVTADTNGMIKIFRQDCAYEPRKSLMDTSQMQKKRYSGITLSPTHSWRESFSIHRTRSGRRTSRGGSSMAGVGGSNGGGGGSSGGTSGGTSGGAGSSIRTASPRPVDGIIFDRGRSRSTSISYSRSPSLDTSFKRPSGKVLAGLNSPTLRPVSPGTNSQTLRSSSSKLRLNEYPHEQQPTKANETILCRNCHNGEFVAKAAGSEMILVCSKCSDVYTK